MCKYEVYDKDEQDGEKAEMEKRVDIVDISVLIFSYSCANFLAVSTVL